MGDLDDDGFRDIVTASAADTQDAIPIVPVNFGHGSPFDDAFYQQNFVPTAMPGAWLYSGNPDMEDGSLAVEISSGNDNQWVKVQTLGTVGLTTGGTVNRDGIGAVVRFRPLRGETAILPVLGGASYASQDSLELGFGLGQARYGTVDVLWPGGVRNRLYGVRHGERVVFPEIPVSIDSALNAADYRTAVEDALRELVEAGVISRPERNRLFGSALRAYRAESAGEL